MVNTLLALEDLNVEEQTAIMQLKQRMIGWLDQDMFDDVSMFVRFLRARDLNINAAEAMLKNHIEWRKKIQVDTILTNYTTKEVLRKYITFDIIGIDKSGSPIFYFHIGNLDARGCLKSSRKSDIIKCIVQKLETNVAIMKKQSFKLDRHIGQWIMVFNFENLTFAQSTHKETLAVIANLISIYEAHYPERLKAAYFINASVYFAMAFEVLKHFISGPTFRKIRFLGNEEWKDELLKVIDSSVLPAFLGGERTDPNGDPMCHSIVTHGGKVPESYYIKKKESTLANTPGVETLTVTRMSKSKVTLAVTEPESNIEWEFETKCRDIGFSLLYKESKLDGPVKVLIPKQRIETNLCSETGMFKCDKLGYYIIEFDNSYSWIHQKEVYYKVSVVTSPLTI